MANEKIPNHICKYSKCDLGVDKQGNACRKHYWACNDCDKINSWKASACCPDHFQLYVMEVEEARNPKVIEAIIETEVINTEPIVPIINQPQIKSKKYTKILETD